MEHHNPESLYRVFSQVIRLHYRRTHSMLEEVGIYPGQPPMLFALHIEDGQSQKDLAAKLKIKPATITMMLKRMERAGLVQRRPDPDDQRISRVYLTEQGRAVWLQVNEVMKTIDEECFAGLTDQEKILLRRLLLQMQANLEHSLTRDGDSGDA